MSDTDLEHTSEQEQDGAATAAAVGAQLRQARESRGESVEEVAHALKLRPRQVEAIEAGRFDELPGHAFVKGFVRNYSRHLGVDVEPVMAALSSSAERIELSPVTNAQGVMPVGGGGSGLVRWLTVMVFAGVLVLGLGWYFDWFRVAPTGVQQADETQRDAAGEDVGALPAVVGALDAEQEERAPQDETDDVVDDGGRDATESVFQGSMEVQVEPIPVSGLSPRSEEPENETGFNENDESGEDGTVVEPEVVDNGLNDAPGQADGVDASESQALVLRTDEEAWVEIRDAAGETLYVGNEPAGGRIEVQGQRPYALVIGNARAVTLEDRGQLVDLGPHTRASGVARLEVE